MLRFGQHGKLTDFDFDNVMASAFCDRTNMQCMHHDLVRQMEFGGSGLYFTGYLVHKDFIDEPNPQNLAPRPNNDPTAVPFPRPNGPGSQSI